jgi:uncharacterized membrane protein
MNLPPIHPALVHLPIAFVILSVAVDFAARITKRESRRAVLRTLGFWSLVAAFAGALLTVATGYLDLNRVSLTAETEEFVQLHMILGWTLTIGLGLLTAWRWLIWHRGQMTINTSYLAGGSIVLGLTLFQGWYGSEMVYSYGAGVAPAGQGTQSPEMAQDRLLAIRNALQPGNTALGAGDSPGGTNSVHETSLPRPADSP